MNTKLYTRSTTHPPSRWPPLNSHRVLCHCVVSQSLKPWAQSSIECTRPFLVKLKRSRETNCSKPEHIAGYSAVDQLGQFSFNFHHVKRASFCRFVGTITDRALDVVDQSAGQRVWGCSLSWCSLLSSSWPNPVPSRCYKFGRGLCRRRAELSAVTAAPSTAPNDMQ